MAEKWYKNTFRRCLIDMHIDDWNDEFLSAFDIDDVIENYLTGKIQAPMIYLQSHTGHCYYRTKSAVSHKAFRKTDKIIRLINKCKHIGLKVVGYYSLIFNVWAELNHPELAMIFPDGKTSIESGSRYGLCCPNNREYRNFLVSQIKEISEVAPNIDGIFYDMPYWPVNCHCPACKTRWEKEVWGELTEEADWSDARWRTLIEKRQDWLTDFTQFVKNITKDYMPGVTCEMNYAGSIAFFGINGETEKSVNDASEFAGGDLYGDLYNHSFANKYFYSVTRNQPFEYMVCRFDGNLSEHTGTKTESRLQTEVYLTAAHHGANLIIDAIDPKGTLDKNVYKKIGKVFNNQIPYEKYYEGELYFEAGVFYDSRALFTVGHGEKSFNRLSALGATRRLIKNHIPVGVLSVKNLDKLKDCKVVIAGELEDFRCDYSDYFISYVKNGGNLYLSGKSNERLMKEFFNAKFVSFTKESKSYIRPSRDFTSIFGEFNENYPLPVNLILPIYEGIDKEYVKSYITLPYTDPDNNRKFAAIHSDPPGIKTDYPAIAEVNYGKGKVIWSAPAIEQDERNCVGEVFINIIERLCGGDFTFKVKLSSTVELVVFKTKKKFLISFIELVCFEDNLTKKYKLQIKTGKEPERVVLLPDCIKMPYTYSGGITCICGEVKNFDMISLEI